jgi:GNAT superfamily N-acetyltransferase
MSSVAIASSSAVPAIGSTLARALADDPGWIYVFPDAATRIRHMTAMLGAMVGRAYVGLGATWATADADAAAVWMPPGRRQVAWTTELAIFTRISWRLRSRLLRALRTHRLIDRHAPSEPHYYLALLGVDPARQGHGLGLRVIQPVLDACDRDRTLAWLETSNPRNHGFYRRVGFTVAAEAPLPRGPTVTFFARQPR